MRSSGTKHTKRVEKHALFRHHLEIITTATHPMHSWCFLGNEKEAKEASRGSKAPDLI